MSNEQHQANVLGGAIGETTQTAAQLAAIAATAAQTVARVRAGQLTADGARDQATADAERTALRTEHAAARLRWGPAFERSFSTASADAAAAVWAATQPWVEQDPTAQEAARRAEERLAALHPHLIVRYQQGIADGLDPIDAMADAATVLAPADLSRAAAAWALAGDERAEALQHAAVPDVATTVSVDEHTQGLRAGIAHAAVSDTANAQAALLAAQAYPHSLRGALGGSTPIGSTRPRGVRDSHHGRRR